MDPNLLLIFGFIILALAIVMPAVFMFVRLEARSKERRLELEAQIEQAKAQQVRNSAEIDRKLEDRVRVLERIATDRGADLAAQIEDLRDRRVNLPESAQ
jgi:hypothetical protein